MPFFFFLFATMNRKRLLSIFLFFDSWRQRFVAFRRRRKMLRNLLDLLDLLLKMLV